MLHRRHKDPGSINASAFDDPSQGEVVRLRRPSRKHNVRRTTANEPGDLLASHSDRRRLTTAELVRSRRVAEPLGEDRQHGLGNSGIQRRRTVVVEIHLAHGVSDVNRATPLDVNTSPSNSSGCRVATCGSLRAGD